MLITKEQIHALFTESVPDSVYADINEQLKKTWRSNGSAVVYLGQKYDYHQLHLIANKYKAVGWDVTVDMGTQREPEKFLRFR